MFLPVKDDILPLKAFFNSKYGGETFTYHTKLAMKQSK